jgi:hypothetical protein
MSYESRALAARAQDWITWYNYNRPNKNSGIEQRLEFLEKANFGALELIAQLVDLALTRGTVEQEIKIALPTGVILHDDIRS